MTTEVVRRQLAFRQSLSKQGFKPRRPLQSSPKLSIMAKLQRRTFEEMDIKANVKQKVLEYLVKKGYNRTEQMLRQESAHLDKDGRPIHNRVEELGNIKYARGFEMLSHWIDQNLDIYKVSYSPLRLAMLLSCFADIFQSSSLGDCSGQCSYTLIWNS
jgi:hypothetical protein